MAESSQLVKERDADRKRVFTRGQVWRVRLAKQYGVGRWNNNIPDDRQANLGNELYGPHMCVILQWDSAARSSVIVVPISSAFNENHQPKKPFPSWVVLHKGDGGAAHKSYIVCEQMRCVDKARVLDYVADLSADRMEKVLEVITELIFSQTIVGRTDATRNDRQAPK